MRKSLVFITSFVSLVLFFAFQAPSVSYAVGTAGPGAVCGRLAPDILIPDNQICQPGYECKGYNIKGQGTCQKREGLAKVDQPCGDQIGEDPEFVCGPNLVCNTDDPRASNLDPTDGFCVEVKTETCTCDPAAPGQPASFTCGGKKYTCGDAGSTCSASSDSSVDRGTVKEGSDIPETTVLKGVSCVAPQNGKAICHCVGKGTDKQNNFECYKEGEDQTKMTGGGWCKDPQTQCVDAPNQVGAPSQFHNYSGFIDEGTGFGQDGYNIVGVKCERPAATCKCNPSIATNGFTCEQFGKKESDTCDSPSRKCIDDEKAVVLNGQGTEHNIFSGAPLKGIRCDDQPVVLPPPPSPPCKEWGAKGQCETFSTAFGDFKTQPEDFITTLFAILLSFSGGIALLLILKAGYQMMTSQGNPEKLNNARDQLVAAIVGLVFLIFSFVILQVIGFDILRIPGFDDGSGGSNQCGSRPVDPATGQCT